jgi:hypothetical protein
MLGQAGLVALFSLAVCLLPLVAGVLYVVRPTEQRLAMMRPISLACIFAALSGFSSGSLHILRHVGTSSDPIRSQLVAIGLSEALVPLYVGFSCLTVAWLCVVVGLRRQ